MRFLRLLTKPTPMLAIGLGVFSVAGSVFVAAGNSALSSKPDKPAAAALLEMYFLLTTVGVGILGGLEQEMTRTISRDLSLGVSPLHTMRGQLRQAAVLGALTVVLVGAFSPFIVSHWLGGHWYLLFELAIGLIASCSSYVIRGLLSGYQKFQVYSGTLMVEGLSRMLPGVILLRGGIHQAWTFGLVYVLASVFASLTGLVGLRRTMRDREPGRTGAAGPGPQGQAAGLTDSTRRAAQNMVLLTLATLASQVVVNGVPLGIPPKLDPAQSLALTSAMGLVRVALLAVFPLQAPLLPKLTRSATEGNMRDLRRQTGLLVGGCVAVGLLGTVGAAVAGPWLTVHYMSTVGLSAQLLAALAFGTTFLMTASLLQTALIALRCHLMVFIAWSVGVVVLAILLVAPIRPLTAAGLAAILSPAAVTLVMFVDLIRVTRARNRQAAETGDPQNPNTDLIELASQA